MTELKDYKEIIKRQYAHINELQRKLTNLQASVRRWKKRHAALDTELRTGGVR
jgi:hypothetical protein